MGRKILKKNGSQEPTMDCAIAVDAARLRRFVARDHFVKRIDISTLLVVIPCHGEHKERGLFADLKIGQAGVAAVLGGTYLYGSKVLTVEWDL